LGVVDHPALCPSLPALGATKLDAAIIGIAERAGGMSVVAYDRNMVIDILARDMPREEAEECVRIPRDV
jgi:hypothetical protein